MAAGIFCLEMNAVRLESAAVWDHPSGVSSISELGGDEK